MLTSSSLFATVQSTGSDTLDAINKFVDDTLNWKQGDPIPDTGSSTLNQIGADILKITNMGCNTPSADGSYSYCSPNKHMGGGAGAGDSWGDPSNPSSDPYGGNGGLPTPAECTSLISNTNRVYNSDPLSACKSEVGANGWWGYTTFIKLAEAKYACRGTINKTQDLAFMTCNVPVCPVRQTYNTTLKKCVIQCPDRQVFDPATNTCKLDPQQCLSPYTLVNGVCVPPKEPDKPKKDCPVGYTLQGDTCVEDPTKPCDPTIQKCNPDGTPVCDCCAKLDIIIGNQGVQINQFNKTNQSLTAIIAQQQTTNLKIDALTQRIEQLKQQNSVNAKINQQQLAEVIKLLKEGVKIDIDPILKKMDDNHADLTKLIAKALIDSPTNQPYLKLILEQQKKQPQATASAVAPIIASATTQITDRQDEQTGLLAQIRDLLGGKPVKEGEKKPEPPDPNAPESDNNDKSNPFDKLKDYDISQNRFGGGGGQCPTDRQFTAMGATYSIGFSQFCSILAMLGNVFVAAAYIAGGIIVVKGAGGN